MDEHTNRPAGGYSALPFKKLLYLPHLLSKKEKRVMALLALLCLTSGTWLLMRGYHNITQPIPAIGSSYTEGAVGEPITINPLLASRDIDRDLSRLVYAGLLTYGPDGTPVPDLADRYEVSADGKIYTVTIRNGLIWHDGKPLTADDVAFTVKLIQNPQYKSPLRANWQGVLAEVLNPQTIRFTLRAPYEPFIENLTVGIIPLHLWENVTPEQMPLHELNLKPVGSGPYQFSGIKQSTAGSLTSYTLTRNKKYHREGPYLQTITFQFYPTESALSSAWRAGTIEGFGPVANPSELPATIQAASLHPLEMPRIFGIFFNQKRSPALADSTVRSAIARAIDKKKLADSASASGKVPLDGVLPWISAPDELKNIFNPEVARTLLDQGGWKETDADGIRQKKLKDAKGKQILTRLAFTLSTSDWPDLLQTADSIKEMLRAVGIEITIEKKPFTELQSSVIRPRAFDILLFGQVYGYEPDPFAFWHSSQTRDPGLNVALYASKSADKLLESARTTEDSAERAREYEQFSRLLLKDTPAVFLFSQLYLYLLPADIQGVNLSKISLPADRFNDINLWYRSTKRAWSASAPQKN
ncbi:MAG: peptide ABC transporter substrate-binding protein [bacterium]|nr:peptide ABC transporter substrate-binding protein [bacterium]MDZ4299910.1 peptide ABC transporter substrate-binding protein [Candidatus Sungbacteria bacterium]